MSVNMSDADYEGVIHKIHQLQADNEQLKAAILKYGNNPAGFDWAVLEEIEKLKEERAKSDSWVNYHNLDVAYEKLKAENSRLKEENYKYGLRQIENGNVIEKLTADLEAARKEGGQLIAKSIQLEKELEAAKKTQYDLEEEIAKVYEDNKQLRKELEAVKKEHQQVLYENNKNFQKLLADKDRQASFAPAFVSSAQNDELAECKKQLRLITDLCPNCRNLSDAQEIAGGGKTNSTDAGCYSCEVERLGKQLAEARGALDGLLNAEKFWFADQDCSCSDCEEDRHSILNRAMERAEQALKARE